MANQSVLLYHKSERIRRAWKRQLEAARYIVTALPEPTDSPNRDNHFDIMIARMNGYTEEGLREQLRRFAYSVDYKRTRIFVLADRSTIEIVTKVSSLMPFIQVKPLPQGTGNISRLLGTWIQTQTGVAA